MKRYEGLGNLFKKQRKAVETTVLLFTCEQAGQPEQEEDIKHVIININLSVYLGSHRVEKFL